MKIGIITTMQHPCNPDLGWGAERYIWDLIDCLDKYGHEVILFGCEYSIPTKHGHLFIVKDESEILNKYSPILEMCDIVHDWSATKTIHDYCQLNNIKSIATNFNVHYLYPKIHKNIVCVSDIQRYLGRSGKSGFEGTQWEQQVGFTGFLRDGKRVYLGIDTDKYSYNSNKDDYILYFNSFDPRKGITLALKLAKEMKFNLVLAGEVKGHFEHQNMFNELKPIMDSMPNVKYEIDVTNERKIELMKNAKAILFPSLFHQPFAVVVIEALSCGTPAIVTDFGAMPEMIIHGETGFICRSEMQLAQAINSINTLDNKKCRESVLNNFTREMMTKEYIKLYNDILNGKNW